MHANKIKFYRITQGLKLISLANAVGVSLGHCSHLENGSKQPSKLTMERIAAALNRSVQDVFYSEYTAEDIEKLKKCGYRLKDGAIVAANKEGS